ncbi:hypothetical protein BpHYR1_013929 [Brachionus plicatilis]|uniref:Uncharacterized protein n=1 Tax=Brachionus plicatilis TaxID=10195 RepID=A0A3M7R494_BRAPC|nr:hypothetical protein BpHYR1_013929 [Brachionus plicatilis]
MISHSLENYFIKITQKTIIGIILKIVLELSIIGIILAIYIYFYFSTAKTNPDTMSIFESQSFLMIFSFKQEVEIQDQIKDKIKETWRILFHLHNIFLHKKRK